MTTLGSLKVPWCPQAITVKGSSMFNVTPSEFWEQEEDARKRTGGPLPLPQPRRSWSTQPSLQLGGTRKKL